MRLTTFKLLSVLIFVGGTLVVAVFSDASQLAMKYGAASTVIAFFLMSAVAFFLPFQLAYYTIAKVRGHKLRRQNG